MSFHHCTKAAARGDGPQPTQTNEFDFRAAGPLLVFAVDSPPCAVPCHGPPVEAAMRSCRILVAVIALLLAPSMAVARGGGGGHGGGGHGGSHSSGGHGGGDHASGSHGGGGHSSGVPHAAPSPHTGGQSGAHSAAPRAPAPKAAAPS